MAVKKLVIVVDGTAAMEPYWNTIVHDYLKKIIRYFCSIGSSGQDSSCAVAELGLVRYHTRGPYTARVAQPTGWTRDMSVFMQWLLDLQFHGGSDDSSAIAEGLADALVMFLMHSNEDQGQQYFQGQRHCILVAASNPFSLPNLVKTKNEISSAETEQEVSDAESIARLFIQFVVSLSVICPKQLPILRKIYDAGNCNLNAPAPFFNSIKNPNFLVLLSEKFLEARTALEEHEEADLDIDLSEEDIMLLQQVMNEPSPSQPSTTAESSPTETVKELDVPQLPHVPLLFPPESFSTTIANSQTYVDDFTSQEMICNESTKLPRAIVLLQRARPLSFPIVNPSIVVSHYAQPSQQTSSTVEIGESLGEHLATFSKYQRNNKTMWSPIIDPELHIETSQYAQNQPNSLFLTSGSMDSGNSMTATPVGFQTTGKRKQVTHESMVSPSVSSKAVTVAFMRTQSIPDNGLISASYNAQGKIKTPQTAGFQKLCKLIPSPDGIMSSPIVKSEAFPAIPQLARNLIAGFTSTGSSVSASLRVPRHLASQEVPAGLDNLQPRARKSHCTGALTEQGPTYKGNPANGFSQSSSSGVKISASLVEAAREADEGLESAILVDAVTKNIQEHNGYVKAWEGAISALAGGHLITIGGAVAYRMASTSEQLTSDWPRTLQLGRLLCQDFFEKFPKPGLKYYLIIEATNNHSILEHLKQRKLCSNIKLPSQTMIFSPTNKKRFFIATVFPGDYPIYRSKVPGLNQCQGPRTSVKGHANGNKGTEQTKPSRDI